MKNKFISFTLIITVIFCLGSCKDKTAETVVKLDDEKYISIYTDVLDRIYDIVSDPKKVVDQKDGEAGITEAAQNFFDSALENIGYAFIDLNADNIPELVIGSSESDYYSHVNNQIYAVYGLKNNIPLQIVEGGNRNIYSITKDNKLFNYASISAMYTSFGCYSISTSLNLECEHYYFTHQKEDNLSQIGYFHNKTGEIDKRLSEELNIRPEAFWNIEQEYADKTISIDFIPFSQYK